MFSILEPCCTINPNLTQAIKDFDKNKDGKLSPEELADVLNEMETNPLLAETFKEVPIGARVRVRVRVIGLGSRLRL